MFVAEKVLLLLVISLADDIGVSNFSPPINYTWGADSMATSSGARPTKHISIEFEIRRKFKTL